MWNIDKFFFFLNHTQFALTKYKVSAKKKKTVELESSRTQPTLEAAQHQTEYDEFHLYLKNEKEAEERFKK